MHVLHNRKSPLGGSLHIRCTHLKQWPPCVHKACTLCLQMVDVVLSLCSLSPEQARVCSTDIGWKKDDMDVGERLGAEDGWRSARGSS